MRWFTFGREGARLPWKEWGIAVKDPEDLMAYVALGRKAYRAFMRLAGLPPQKGAEGALTAFAHILHHTLDEMDEGRWMELRFLLQESWVQEDPGLWDPPALVIRPPSGGLAGDLLALHHMLERAVGPDLLRLSWCSMTSSGRNAPMRPMEAGELLLPLMMLDRTMAENIPPFLDQEEREGMSFLREELRLSERIFMDELADGLSAQGHIVRQGEVWIAGMMSGGSWHGSEEVARWRERGLRCCALLLAFRVMFLASVTGESGPLRVSFPPQGSD